MLIGRPWRRKTTRKKYEGDEAPEKQAVEKRALVRGLLGLKDEKAA
jgi:hypothetical protein